MEHSVEVASLVRGEVVSVRRLSARQERRDVLLAAALAGGLVLAAMAGAAVLVAGVGRVLYAPMFLAAWGGAAVFAALAVGRRARARARRYTIGAEIDADAFGAIELDLVRRSGSGYAVALVPGMSGTFENGRSPLPVEALTQHGPAWVMLPEGGRAAVVLGATTFVVRWAKATSGKPLRLPSRAVARVAMAAAQVAAVITFFCTVRVASEVSEKDMMSSIPRNATPWEVEKLLRAQAQIQAGRLHACFDPLPVSCQRPGYVGVGVSLTKEGEIRSHWIARSTYGSDCPVDACMSAVVSSWFFEPLPEPMRVILPVQVLRTSKALPKIVRTSSTVMTEDGYQMTRCGVP